MLKNQYCGYFLFHFWVIYYFLAPKFLSELNLILVFTCFQTQQPCILLSWCTVKSKQKKSILGLNRNHQLILYVLVNINIIICIYIYIYWISATRFAELIQFWQDPKCRRNRTFWRKKLSVSLEKDFIFRFQIYFPLVLLLISSFQILVSVSYFLVSQTTAMNSFNIETLNSGENRPL